MSDGADVRRRNSSLDFLKIVATCLIACHHYQQIVGSWGGPVLFYGGLVNFSYVVELFFVLSGLFAARVREDVEEKRLSFPQFFGRRVARLLPMIMPAVLGYDIATFLYRYQYGEFFWGIEPTVWGSILTCLGIQSGWGLPDPFLNIPLWYISVLLACYLLFFLILTIAGKARVTPVYFFIGMLFVGNWVMILNKNIPFATYGMGRGYCGFFAGVLLAEVWKRADPSGAKPFLVSLAVVLGSVVLAILTRNDSFLLGMQRAGYTESFLDIVFYPALITFVMFRPIRNLMGRIQGITLLAETSYAVYVWQYPMLIVLLLLGGAKRFANGRSMGIFLVWMFLWGMGVYLLIYRGILPKRYGRSRTNGGK